MEPLDPAGAPGTPIARDQGDRATGPCTRRSPLRRAWITSIALITLLLTSLHAHGQESALPLIDRCESIVDVENYPALAHIIDSLQREGDAHPGTSVLRAALHARYL